MFLIGKGPGSLSSAVFESTTYVQIGSNMGMSRQR